MIILAGYKLTAAILIFMVSAILPALFLKKRGVLKHGEPMSLGEAFAAGIFLGAAFFHLLPDATHLFNESYPNISYPVPGVVCVSGILLFFILERFSHASREGAVKRVLPGIVMTILVIHALTEGAALGMGNVFSETAMLFIAIIAHKGSEGFALAMVLLRYGWPLKRVLRVSLLFAAMTPIGILLGASLYLVELTHGELLESLFSAFAAGTFIYIGTLHHVHNHSHGKSAKHLLFAGVGVAIMGVLAFWA
jgi:solute carrier family 39 (zinc transporter), member 1/2/3